ncbi:hypothetical protein C8F04DRAFT_1198957 [Mycena alexandri]|uniref:Uncharacterized protein n=1 Tax=Mycena alexandri TaxID=1745969 RepID=A0AAD6WRP5_9AGAR|nr:hypothetical protein C8F04DRAFT_1198957 [Mycena alexandri]
MPRYASASHSEFIYWPWSNGNSTQHRSFKCSNAQGPCTWASVYSLNPNYSIVERYFNFTWYSSFSKVNIPSLERQNHASAGKVQVRAAPEPNAAFRFGVHASSRLNRTPNRKKAPEATLDANDTDFNPGHLGDELKSSVYFDSRFDSEMGKMTESNVVLDELDLARSILYSKLNGKRAVVVFGFRLVHRSHKFAFSSAFVSPTAEHDLTSNFCPNSVPQLRLICHLGLDHAAPDTHLCLNSGVEAKLLAPVFHEQTSNLCLNLPQVEAELRQKSGHKLGLPIPVNTDATSSPGRDAYAAILWLHTTQQVPIEKFLDQVVPALVKCYKATSLPFDRWDDPHEICLSTLEIVFPSVDDAWIELKLASPMFCEIVDCMDELVPTKSPSRDANTPHAHPLAQSARNKLGTKSVSTRVLRHTVPEYCSERYGIKMLIKTLLPAGKINNVSSFGHFRVLTTC